MASSITLRNEEQEKAYMHALELACSPLKIMTIRAAIELGVLDVIVDAGPGAKLTATQIVGQMPNVANPEAPDMVDRMLRLLAADNIVEYEIEEDGLTCKYGAAPVCKYLANCEEAVSLGPLLHLITDNVYHKSQLHMKDAIVNGGKAFDIAFNMGIFDYARTNQHFDNMFNVAMKSYSVHIARKVIDIYNGFKDIKTLVDVGGGIGTTISMIVAKYPHIKGINFDLPHVISNAETYQGVEHVGGDMFENIPCGDAIFMKNILHNWDDEHCLKILKNCYKSLPQNGKMVIVEYFLPKASELTKAPKLFTYCDLLMMVNFGGKERSKEAFEELCLNAGFSAFKATYFLSQFAVIEFIK